MKKVAQYKIIRCISAFNGDIAFFSKITAVVSYLTYFAELRHICVSIQTQLNMLSLHLISNIFLIQISHGHN